MTPVFEEPIDDTIQLDEPMAPKRTRRQEFWALFRKNKLAASGLAIFIVFSFIALSGLFLTSGNNPMMDPAKLKHVGRRSARSL